MEETKKNNTVIIIILVLMVLGLGGYIFYDKVISKDNISSGTDSSEKNDSNVKNGDVITDAIVKELYNKIEGSGYFLGKETFEADITEFDGRFLYYLILTNLKESDLVPSICNTEYETDLINKEIIGEQNDSQYDCKSTSIFTAESVERVKKELFGDAKLNLTMEENDNPFFYYEKGNFYVARYCCIQGEMTYEKYETNGDIVTIYTSFLYTPADEKNNLKFNFKHVDNNFYLVSIESFDE